MATAALVPAATIKEEYDREFQKQILAMMYSDNGFLRMIADVIKPEHFDDKIDAAYAEIFLEFARKFPKDKISKFVVFNEIKKLILSKRIEDEDRHQYITRFAQIATTPVAPEYVRTELRRFALSKTLEVELVGAVDLMRKGRYREIVDRINKAFSKIDSSKERSDIQIIKTIDDRIVKLKDPEAALRKDGISTGLEKVDNLLYRHGTGRGEMMVICGSPGRGKSIWLANLTMAAILRGHNALYYTLEMAADIVTSRIDAMTTGIPFVELIRYADLVAERWGIIQTSFKLGEIFLHDLPPRYLTPNMIRQHLYWYQDQGINISVLVVDYADIMASDKKIDERRLEHGDVYEQIRSIGKEFGVAVLTASQANRDSLRKKAVDIDSLAEDFSKAMTADYVIGLSQTKSEETFSEEGRGTGLMRAFVAKNRNGPKGVEAEFLTDFTKMRVSMKDFDNFDLAHFGRIIK